MKKGTENKKTNQKMKKGRKMQKDTKMLQNNTNNNKMAMVKWPRLAGLEGSGRMARSHISTRKRFCMRGVAMTATDAQIERFFNDSDQDAIAYLPDLRTSRKHRQH